MWELKGVKGIYLHYNGELLKKTEPIRLAINYPKDGLQYTTVVWSRSLLTTLVFHYLIFSLFPACTFFIYLTFNLYVFYKFNWIVSLLRSNFSSLLLWEKFPIEDLGKKWAIFTLWPLGKSLVWESLSSSGLRIRTAHLLHILLIINSA